MNIFQYPFPSIPSYQVDRLIRLGYPSTITSLVYSQFEDPESQCPSFSPESIWLCPGQESLAKKPTGNQVLMELIRTGLIDNTATFHILKFYELVASYHQPMFSGYSHIIAWKGLAINNFGDKVVPMLYLKSAPRTIQWVSLSLCMHAGEGTLLLKNKEK